MNVNLEKAKPGDYFLDSKGKAWVYIKRERRMGMDREHLLYTYFGDVPGIFDHTAQSIHPYCYFHLIKKIKDPFEEHQRLKVK